MQWETVSHQMTLARIGESTLRPVSICDSDTVCLSVSDTVCLSVSDTVSTTREEMQTVQVYM